ncbi:hypothetical protein CWB73_05125 [Pseudoalteromonas phenolica]|uniref:Uncharacterized protein n=1 Tax=Pseudoalteromonas phenolica TaxID=161398 RepID=A0A5S3YXP3_9GAMM|nr:hypothetical protein [Pseudoalteromonas phenolica]TMP82272.1 hypothetical protein CWB73_05125 [Pseudoalteromonas phenolica]
MRKLTLLVMMLCILSTQVFGSVAHGEKHHIQGDVHQLLHEIGQPHSHDHDDKSEFEISFSKDAVKHINQDLHCCATVALDAFPYSKAEIKPMGSIVSINNNWSPPFIKHTTPPPRA